MNAQGYETEKGSTSMEFEDNLMNNCRLWRFIEVPLVPGYYKIKNLYSLNVLNAWANETGKKNRNNGS
jgi:hypothetical protein